MGYWKGSGISVLLDLISTVLTNANSVQKIGTFEEEVGLSQIMIAIDPTKLSNTQTTDQIVNMLIDHLHASEPVKEGEQVLYPGERVIRTRRDNLENGIPVIEEKWREVLAM